MAMDFLNDLGNTAQAVANAATEKAKNAVDLVKINMAIASEQREIDKNYRAIGEWMVNEYEGEVPGALRELIDAVAASKEKIAELEAGKPAKQEEQEAAAEESPAGKACPICGAVSDSKFCPQCGAPMGE